ncbi:cerebellin 18 [Sparus aurata]|uniref:Caprin-2-like n=1 Tax=Sparus aurata TaxID=8175 RepID=A0A671TGT5_SPAAU|nr:caprin-2-like [Sparus aurata]
MLVLPVLFLLGSLFLCGCTNAGEPSTTIEMLKMAALQYEGPLTCHKTMDCNCAFNHQRGCCCAANDMYKVEEETFIRIKFLWHDISTLSHKIHSLTDSHKVAFTATIVPGDIIPPPQNCFGPFNTNVSIPYTNVTLNDGGGYNPSLGTFTAPYAGYYSFSCTVYSYVGQEELLYHKVQMIKNGIPLVGVWENNREDGEDSATQVVIVVMNEGDQVYMQLVSGRKLCSSLQHNIFTGYMVYPKTEEYGYEYNHGY